MTESDSDSDKSYDKATKKFYSRVAERTRSKRDSFCEISHRTSQNAISPPIARHEHKRRKVVKPGKHVIEIDDVSDYRKKSKCSASGIKRSSKQGLNASTSCNNANIPRKKPRAFVQKSSEHVGLGKRLYQRGNGSEDSDSEGNEITDKAEFMSQNSCSASKIGPSSKGKLKASFPAATPRKDVSSSSGYCETFRPKDAFRGSDHTRTHASRACIELESDSDDMILEDYGIKTMDESRRNQKKCYESNIGPSSKRKMKARFPAATPRKDASSSAGYFRGSDHARRHASRAYHQIESDSDDMISEDSGIKIMDDSNIGRSAEKALCGNCSCKDVNGAKKKSISSATFSRRNDCTGPDMLAADNSSISARKFHSRKNADTVKESSFRIYSVSLSEDAEEQADSRPRSFTETVKSEEETETDEVDESEFWKMNQFDSKIGPSNGQERHCAAASAKNVTGVSKKKKASFTENIDKDKMKQKVSSYSESKKKGEPVHYEVDDSSSSFIDSYSSSESKSEDDEVSSHGAKLGMDIGVASRTRSKMGSSVTKPAKAVNDSYNLSTDSGSSSTDSGNHSFHSSDDGIEILEPSISGNHSSDDGIEILDPSIGARAFQNIKLVSAEKDEDDGTEEVGDAVEHASDQSHSKIQSKESNCEKPALESQKESSGKRQSNDDASSKPAEEGKAHQTCEVNDQSQEGIKRPNKGEEEGKSHTKCVVQEDDKKDGDEVNMINELPPKRRVVMPKKGAAKEKSSKTCALQEDQSQDGIKRPNKGAEEGTSQSKCEVQADDKKDGDKVNMINELPPKRRRGRPKKGAAKEKSPKTCALQEDQSQDGIKRPNKGAEEGTSHTKCEVQADDKKDGDEVNMINELPPKRRRGRPKKGAAKEKSPKTCALLEDDKKGNNELHPKKKSQAEMRRRPKKAAEKEAHKKCEEQEDIKEVDQNILQNTACSKESYTHMGCDGVLHLKEQSQTEMRSLEKADLPSPSKYDDDQSGDEDDDTREVPTGKDYNLCNMLADVILGKGQMTENDSDNGDEVNHEESKKEPAPQAQDTLPLRFRFEDEVPKPVEKTDFEKEIDEMFDELDCNWALEEMRTFNYPEVNLENEKSPAEETQYDRCCRGKHDLIHEDDEGLLCIFCHHVVLGPKDIMPEWIERPFQDSASKKRYSEREETLEEFDEHLQSSIDNVADCDATGTVWSIKPGVRESMYEHQREGFEFLWKNLAGSINVDEVKSKSNDSADGVGGCIISHAPGTGKTLLTIVFLETYLRMFPHSRPVIIGPASMLLTWEEEFKKWNVGFPFLNLNNSDLSGKDKSAVSHLAPGKSRNMNYVRMIKMFNWNKGGSILGISYTMFENLVGENIKGKKKREAGDHINNKMRQILLEMPGLVVLDEGHTPRNERSNIWNALLKLKTEKRVILSGTPFQNNFGELFNTFRLVRPAVADVLAQEKTYADMVASKRISPSISEAAVESLKLSMSPFVHVHKGTILQQSLPGLGDSVVVLKPPTLQKSLIEGIDLGSNNFKYEHDSALLSVHPYLLLHCDCKSTEAQIDMDAVRASKLHPQEGAKTRFVVELVRLSMAVDEKVIIFSQFIRPLELIMEHLKETFKWVEGREILLMKGRIDNKLRQVMINSFNDPKSESKIMLASTKCCSEGISLVGASRVVLLDVVWNPSVERQAISRAYRIGQKKFVYTYHLMTSGTTEADKYCRQAEKDRMSELVFTSANEKKHLPVCMEDRILEVMLANQSLKGIFEKIINQPKETDLIESFAL